MKQEYRRMDGLFIVTLLLCGSFSACIAQAPFGTHLLHLSKTIQLPEVKGRIDHLDINVKDQVVYMAALGNNTVEVLDISTGKSIHSIKGLDEPQGVGYIPQKNEIIVANGGNGDCYFFNAHSFEKVATIHLESDADDVRYDSSEKKIYVGYGKGGIAVIDPYTHKQVGDVKLPAHPESFQLDTKLHLLFVNLPDAHMVGMVDLIQLKLTGKWKRSTPSANFPMAVDTVHHRVFVGYRHPARLVVYDGSTGKELVMNEMTGDADDLYYDDKTAEVLVSGGEGTINIFQQQGDYIYKQIANIPTRNGARTSLWVPQLRTLVVAARAASGEPADLLVYFLTP
jgi:DNA-binding beta-propeller fold protein YncE